MSTDRALSFVDAIREATDQEMARDERVLLFGLDVDDPKAILGTTKGLAERYGRERVFGTPLSEDAMTGAAVGMALAGLRPIHVHIRMDFVMLAMNQLINMAAKTHYMFGGQESCPLVVRSIIGKSWGQGAQHSQGLYSFFMHVPGLKVVAPSTPYDAKGCLAAAVRDENPVMFIEHRILYYQRGPVPETSYEVKPGKARVAIPGNRLRGEAPDGLVDGGRARRRRRRRRTVRGSRPRPRHSQVARADASAPRQEAWSERPEYARLRIQGVV